MYNITPDDGGTTRAKTPEFRSSYAYVFEARETQSGEMKFSTSMIFPKADKAKLKGVAQAIINAASRKFGTDPKKWPKTLKCPIRDGDEEREGKEYANSVFMNAGNKSAPGVIDKNGMALTGSDEFYSGAYGRASISFFPFDVKGNKGVGAGLNNILKMRDGERMDGAVSAEDDFADDIEEVQVDESESESDDQDDTAF